MDSMIGHWNVTAIDCEDPRALAEFYSALTGLPRLRNSAGWVEIGIKGSYPRLAFQQVKRHVPPSWPEAENGQQMHLDIKVDDLDEAEAKVLALGARKVGRRNKGFRVYLDPAGHPFCLVD